jgi:TRAP-type transport system periplasmic protein
MFADLKRLVGTCWLIALVGITQPSSAQVALNIATEYPETAMPGEGLKAFAETVRILSKGELQFAPSFDAKAGFKSNEMIAAVASKKLDAGDAYLPAVAAINPLFSLSALPFVVSAITDAKALMQQSRSAYQSALDQAGVRWLYSTPWPATGIWSKTLLKNADDLKNLRLRTYDSVSQSVMAPLVNAAMNVSFADVMPMLKDGRATAVLSSGDGGAGRKLWEFLPHFTEINYAIPISVTFMNKSVYEALSAEMRQIIDQAAMQTEVEQWRRIEGRLAENYTRMRSNGVEINVSPDADLKALLSNAAKPIISEWKMKVDPETAKLIQ